uniref:Uncharacterized protein n=1 Tax=Siphoviridae sp. ct5op20 TaxID=2826295 RepID=A0A8S5NQ45_9CAUD|nr:MAG TPA: hypothetical protein [Siphoviridae sp. ct5op20]
MRYIPITRYAETAITLLQNQPEQHRTVAHNP